MPTILYTHQSFSGHEAPPGHVEHSGRYGAVELSLTGADFTDLIRKDAPLGSMAMVSLAHPEDYEALIKDKSPQEGLVQLDADTFMGPTSLEATLRAVGAATDAVDHLYAGKAKNAFVAARPPGHHAEASRAMGFCIFNHVAIAARYARHAHGAKRIAVVDFDVHHGNGTEAIFWNDEYAFFASSHEWPQYPGTGRISDCGAFGNITNAPLETGTAGEGFRRQWGDRLLPALSEFNPDIIIISAGFDAHAADPLGGLLLTEADFSWVTNEICAVAQDCCNGRIVSVLEGGYDLPALGASAAAHVRSLMSV